MVQVCVVPSMCACVFGPSMYVLSVSVVQVCMCGPSVCVYVCGLKVYFCVCGPSVCVLSKCVCGQSVCVWSK